MEFDINEYRISKELKGIFDSAREDASEDTKKKIDEVWSDLQTTVDVINRYDQAEPEDLEKAVSNAEKDAFWKLDQIITEVQILEGTIKQNDLERYLGQELKKGVDLSDNKLFKKALKLCENDELLYYIAKISPQDKFFSFGDVAAQAIRNDEMRYALICSSITGRKTLIHELAIERKLKEMLAIRILLTDPYEENKRESLYVINSEALLMLAFLRSFSYRKTAGERLKEIGSSYPEAYFDLKQKQREETYKNWYAEACEYGEALIDLDKTIEERIDAPITLNTSLLIGFLAAAHPDPKERIRYAQMIKTESLAAYVGAITEYQDVKKYLSVKINDKDILDNLPYCLSDNKQPYLLEDRQKKRDEFCLEVLRNTDDKETWEYLLKKMDNS